ncbi:extracellular solute-binding protein [Roseicitreum antarcticum]
MLGKAQAIATPRPDMLTMGLCGLSAVLWLGWASTAQGQAQMEGEVITSHGISTFGDLKYPADYPHLDYVNPDAPKGGEIAVWAPGGFDSMHPFTVSGRAGALSSIFFESMLTGTADEIGASYCLLCETMEYPEDRSWVTFNIRPEARFSDGTPLTADDALFSYEILLEKGLPEFRAILSQQVERVEVEGDHRVTYYFNPDFPPRDLPALVGGLSVFSRADYVENDRDFEVSSMEPMLGSAPYTLDRARDNTLVYARNPDYWGWHLPIMQGRSNFDRIRVEYYADYTAAFEGFKAGAYTFRDEASSLIWATGYDFPDVADGHVIKAELPNGNISTGQAFILNLRRQKLQDPRVREAISMMFNFEWSNETLFYGIYARNHSLWENSDLAASGQPSAEELALLEPLADMLPPGVLDAPPVMAPESSATRQLDRGNLRRASALLSEAGWDVGNDGLRRNADGEVLTLEFLNDSQSFDRVINPYVENLRALGIDARHNRVDNAQAVNRERSYDFDITTDQLPMSEIPSSSLMQFFGSETADQSTRNKMGLRSEAVDSLIRTVLDAESQEELTHSVRALDRVLRAYQFRVPQWFKNAHTVAYFDQYGYPDPLPPHARGELDFWWFDADKAAQLRADGALR